MKFELTEEQVAKATAWINEVARPEAIKIQRGSTRNPSRDIVECYWNEGTPYAENISWSFSDSSGIGQVAKVTLKAGAIKLEYDLTDYDTW